MITVRLSGGLGNQMFQYACARSLALSNDTKFVLDTTYLVNRIPKKEFTFRDYELGVFNIVDNFSLLSKVARLFNNAAFILQYLINKIKKNIYKNFFIREINPCLYQELKINSNSVFLSGQWSSEKYFINYAEVIQKDFSYKIPLVGKNLELSHQILNSNSVSLHVRRGDYVKLGIDDICNLDYYKRAVDCIYSKIKKPVFFIFSDDIDWVEKNLIIPGEKNFVNHNKGKEAYIDMRLMSLCKHNIIAHSSFSWWGAWLNKNKDKIVISPSFFSKIDLEIGTGDVIPEKWIKL